MRRECPEFKAWLAKKRNDDIISFIDDSFFTYYSSKMWWIDSGVSYLFITGILFSLDHKRGEKTQC
jgi:hypothetical protein